MKKNERADTRVSSTRYSPILLLVHVQMRVVNIYAIKELLCLFALIEHGEWRHPELV